MGKAKTEPKWEPTGDTFIEPCDVKGCRFDFHQYAIHSDLNSKRLLVTDMDGNKEYEADSYLECTTKPEVMRDYLRSVAETGDDYLGVLIVTDKRSQTWTATLGMWLGARQYGMRVSKGRRVGRKSTTPDKFPLQVAQFLEMKQRRAGFYVSSVRSVAELEALAARDGNFTISRNLGIRATIKFPVDVLFTPAQSKRAIMQAAHKALAKGAAR